MKKLLLTLFLFISVNQYSKSCIWYDEDYNYFNLFAQEMIEDHSYYPFLLTYSNAFYEKK